MVSHSLRRGGIISLDISESVRTTSMVRVVALLWSGWRTEAFEQPN
jgi:hypothetical protein